LAAREVVIGAQLDTGMLARLGAAARGPDRRQSAPRAATRAAGTCALSDRSAGRRALEAYRLARQTVIDELGLEPEPELQTLQQRILNHDPALDAVALSAPAEPRPRPGFPASAES
jgi:hypothetical protein